MGDTPLCRSCLDGSITAVLQLFLASLMVSGASSSLTTHTTVGWAMFLPAILLLILAHSKAGSKANLGAHLFARLRGNAARGRPGPQKGIDGRVSPAVIST